jgi:hypothetical protein
MKECLTGMSSDVTVYGRVVSVAGVYSEKERGGGKRVGAS